MFFEWDKLYPSNKKYSSKIGVFPKPRVKHWLKFSHFFFLLHQLIDSKKENQVGTYSIANIRANFVRVKKCICMIVITKQVWQKHKPGEQINIEKVEERKKNSVIDVSSSKDSRTHRKIPVFQIATLIKWHPSTCVLLWVLRNF